MCRAHLEANVASRGEHFGVRVTRRHLTGYLKGLPGAAALRKRLLVEDSLARCLEILDSAQEAMELPGICSSLVDVVLLDSREHPVELS